MSAAVAEVVMAAAVAGAVGGLIAGGVASAILWARQLSWERTRRAERRSNPIPLHPQENQ